MGQNGIWVPCDNCGTLIYRTQYRLKKNERREATFIFPAVLTSKQSAQQTIERDSAGLRVVA